MQDVYSRARTIRLAVFDIDGVLTDGGLYYSDSGEEIKVFDVRDGHGMKMLQASGVGLAIITGRTSQCVARRTENLGIEYVFQGVDDKLATLRALAQKLSLDLSACAYMGDDWIDLPILTRCGLALSVPDAHAEVLSRAHYVTRAAGGRGAVREACELIMRAQGTYESRLAGFLT
ncbi:MAG TPA: HAD family hydrolase [Burkholderiales bacterium]|nr:HAD family hydrolase [Burkholderiales bacterium]